MRTETRPPGSGRAGIPESSAATRGEWRAVGWNAALAVRGGRPTISLAFRGGGELRAERRNGHWVVVGGSDDGLALVDDLVRDGVLTRGPAGTADSEREHRLAIAVVESALGQ